MITKATKRNRRKLHIRKTLNGTTDKPRVYVYKSNKYFYVAVADDDASKTFKSVKVTKGIKSATEVGKTFAKELAKLKKDSFVFDRSGYKFHGSIKTFVESLRENGIKI